MTVTDLRSRLTPGEFAQWMAFDRIEPIGVRRSDWQTALICHVIASAYAKEPPPISRFLVDWWGAKEGGSGGNR